MAWLLLNQPEAALRSAKQARHLKHALLPQLALSYALQAAGRRAIA